MRKHVNLTITGKVQGVWYRASAQREAVRLGLKGFVRNMPDGSVYAEAEGEEEELQAFITWCRKGPELAEVENVEIEEAPLKSFVHFEVAR